MIKLQVECLAYWLWQRRGMPIGSPDEDWFLAEQLLKRRGERLPSSLGELPIFACGLSKRTF